MITKMEWDEIHHAASRFYRDILLYQDEGEVGRAYFKTRNISERIIKQYHLGYAPQRWDALFQHLKQKFSLTSLVESGLIMAKPQRNHPEIQQYFDRFRNRVIFPLLDKTLTPIGFGARTIDNNDRAKYLNSPEGAFFKKGKFLYGIHQAYQGIPEKGYSLLVEGYMDVIALQRAGFNHAVASMGTALTLHQARELLSYSPSVIIGYDSDEAGIAATLRSGEILNQIGMDVRILTFSKAKDADEFLKTHSVQRLEIQIQQSVDFFVFKYAQLKKEMKIPSMKNRMEMFALLSKMIQKAPQEKQNQYLQLFSKEMRIPEVILKRELTIK